MRRITLAAAVLILTAACSSLRFYSVGFDGYTAGGSAALPPGTKVFLVKNEQIDNPLLESEVRRKLGSELEARGYVLTPAAEADVFLLAGFGIGAPRQEASVSAIYNPGTTSTISANGVPVATVQSSAGFEYVPTTETVNDRWLVLLAADGRALRERNEVSILWRGQATSSGSSSDLRQVLNYLLVPALENIGKNTGKRVNYLLNERDGRAQRVSSR